MLFALFLGPDPLLPMPAPSLFFDLTALPLADGLRLSDMPIITLSSSLSPSLLLPRPGLSMVAQGGDVLSCPVQASAGVDLPGKARRKYGLFFFFSPKQPPAAGQGPLVGAIDRELQPTGRLCRDRARRAGWGWRHRLCGFGVILINKLQFFRF